MILPWNLARRDRRAARLYGGVGGAADRADPVGDGARAASGSPVDDRGATRHWVQRERRGLGADAMKVVIFCGGLGVRMGEETQRIPKPMIEIGGRPILWHIMQLLRRRGGTTSSSSASATRARSSRSTSSTTTRRCSTTSCSIATATARRSSCSAATSPTGGSRSSTPALNATIGERLKAVAPYLGDDEYFLATYGDGLTDAPLPELIDALPRRAARRRMFLSVRPQFNAHVVDDRRRRHRRRDRGHEPLGRPDQRRLLRLPARDPRPDRARATSSSRSRSRG